MATRPIVVLIEDDPLDAEALRRQMQKQGFSGTLRHHGTGEWAIEALRGGECPDLVLVDLGLPGIDGVETISRIRKLDLPGTMPIIALTGSSEEAEMSRAYRAGASSYTVKSATPEIFAAVVGRILENWLVPQA